MTESNAEKELTANERAQLEIKAIYDDGVAEINGRSYKFTVMTHEQRRSVFAYYSTIRHQLSAQDFGFTDSAEFKAIEKKILARVTFEDMQLSKLDQHFDTYISDYYIFICTALAVVSYPFFPVGSTS